MGNGTDSAIAIVMNTTDPTNAQFAAPWRWRGPSAWRDERDERDGNAGAAVDDGLGSETGVAGRTTHVAR